MRRHRKGSICRAGRSATAASPRSCSCCCSPPAPTRCSRIGQKEDPDFTFRVMVVQVALAGRNGRGDAGSGGRQDRAQAAGNAGSRLRSLLHAARLRQHLRQPEGLSARRGRQDAFYQARKKVGDIRQTLPEGVIGPFFNDEFGDTYISLYAITGQGYSYPELKNFAKNARDILLRVPGRREGRSPGAAGEAHLHRGVVRGAGRARADAHSTFRRPSPARMRWTPQARIETGARSVRIDVQGGLRSVEDIRELRLRAGQQTFRLGDIAEVRRGPRGSAISQDPLSGPGGGTARHHDGAGRQRDRGRCRRRASL